jgi:hypothetical protein
LATQNLTTADAILKDLYVGPVVEQLNYKSYMIDQIERQSEFTVDHYGRKAIVPVHKSRNRGRGSRGDGGVLPSAGRQSWDDAIIPITRHYQGIELTDAAIKATQSNSGAFVELLDAEVKGATKDMKKDVNRQVFGTGDGLLATFGTAITTATNTLTVDSIQYLHVGDPVDIRRKTDGTAVTGGTGLEVTALAGSTKTVTLNTTITTGSITASQYGVYLAGSRGLEMEGLQSIVSTSRTLHSINSATAGNEFWNAQVRDVGTSGTSATAGETSFELISDDVGQTGQGDTEVFITTRGIRRRLADTFQSTKRFTNREAVQIHGGYSAIMVASGAGEVPVVIDDDAPKGTVFAIDKSALRWFQQWGPGFLESPQDSTVFHLKDDGTGQKEATWQAWMGWYATLACVAPNRLGRLRYCTDDDAGVTA